MFPLHCQLFTESLRLEVLRQDCDVGLLLILISRGKVGDIENDVKEDNHDEYQKGRGENQEEDPDNIETPRFSLQSEMKCLKLT